MRFASVVTPILPSFLTSHPDIHLEVIIDDSLTDIVENRIDAGIRFDDIVEKDMIAVRISPTLEWPSWAPRLTLQNIQRRRHRASSQIRWNMAAYTLLSASTRRPSGDGPVK